MAGRNLDEASTIEAAVAKALTDAGIPDYNTPLRATLVHDAEVFDRHRVVVTDPEGRSVTLQERIEQMKQDPRWRREFPQAPPAASRSSKSGVPAAGAILQPNRAAFDDIVSGKAVVR